MDFDIPKKIYHISTEASWQIQQHSNYYSHESLSTEGFIHCCTASQLDGVLERYFTGVNDIVSLHLEVDKISAELKFELAPTGEYFPHIYGPVSKVCIVDVQKVR